MEVEKMGPDKDSPNSGKYDVDVVLSPSTPVVDCQINPAVYIFPKPPPHFCNFSWYKESVFCSVHPSKEASLQCIPCKDLNLVKRSYHCSTKCFIEAWPRHLTEHETHKLNITNTNQPKPKTHRSSGSGFEDDFEGAADIEDEAIVWSKLADSETYKPLISDLGFRLKLDCLAKDKSTGIPLALTNVTMMNPVIEFPSRCPRRMIHFKGVEAQSGGKGVTFRVLSYNILAPLYAHQYYYPYCPQWALSWEFRRENLLREILEYDADIICLQEVQSDHYESFIEPELTKHGYLVQYKKKINKVFTRTGYVIDGCATFYRSSLFKEVKTYEVEFGEMASSIIEVMEPALKNVGVKRLTKDNVAVVVVLEVLKEHKTNVSCPSRICVANTHIHANPKFPDVKLYQVVSLVRRLESIHISQVPLLICGDLNCLPNSDPLTFILNSGSNPFAPDNDCDPSGIYKHIKFNNSLYLKSAYKSLFHAEGVEEHQLQKMDPQTKEPLFTSYTPGFCDTIDYILYSGDSFKVNGVLELLDRESLGLGIPSPHWSSDHIALMASFRLISNPAKGSIVPPLPSNRFLRCHWSKHQPATSDCYNGKEHK